MKRGVTFVAVLIALSFFALDPALTQNCGTASGSETTSNCNIGCDPGSPPGTSTYCNKSYSTTGSTTCSGSPQHVEGCGTWNPATQSGSGPGLNVNSTGTCACPPEISGASSRLDQGTDHYDFVVSYRNAVYNSGTCSYQYYEGISHVDKAATCNSSFCCGNTANCESCGNRWDSATCECRFSPLMLDTSGAGLSLSSASQGVVFDLSPGPPIERVAWPTQPDAVAFIVVDLNGNGAVDDGRELIGSASAQAAAGERNGFNALTLYDTNGDGVVSANDASFELLQLWFDTNRDGRTQPGELFSLSAGGVVGLSLRYQEIERRDESGNIIAYRSRSFVRGPEGSAVRAVWLYDAFLRTEVAESGGAVASPMGCSLGPTRFDAPGRLAKASR